MLSIAVFLVTWAFDVAFVRGEFGERYVAGNRDNSCPHERYPEKYFGYRSIQKGQKDEHCIIFFPLANITDIDYKTFPKEAEYNYCRREFEGGLAPFKDALDDIAFSFSHRHPMHLITIEEVKKHFGNMTFKLDSGFNYFLEEEIADEFLHNRYYKCKKVYVNSTPHLADGTFEACTEAHRNGTLIPDGHYFPLRTAKKRPKIKEILFTVRPSALCEYYVFAPAKVTTAKTVLCENRPKDLYFACYMWPDHNCIMERVWGCTYRPEFKTCYQFRYRTVRQIYKGGIGIPCPADKYDEKYRCRCPCTGTWKPWSPWSASCGVATRFRLRPKMDANPDTDCLLPDKEKCCDQHQEKVFADSCEDFIPNTNISLRSKECENGLKLKGYGTGHFFCECFPGFTGLLCEQRVDACASNPCRQGTCSNVGSHYHCSCKTGYEGINCERSFEQCGPHRLCMNNGNCTELEDGKKCVCPQRWGGKYCEEKAEWCKYGTCSLKGTCFNTSMNTITCICEQGAYGKYCDIEKVPTKQSSVQGDVIGSNTMTIVLGCLIFALLLIGCLVVHAIRKKNRHRWRGGTEHNLLSPIGLGFLAPSVVQTREVQGSKGERQEAMGVSLKK